MLSFSGTTANRLTEWEVRMRRQSSDPVDLVPLDLKSYNADLLTLPHVATLLLQGLADSHVTRQLAPWRLNEQESKLN